MLEWNAFILGGVFGAGIAIYWFVTQRLEWGKP